MRWSKNGRMKRRETKHAAEVWNSLARVTEVFTPDGQRHRITHMEIRLRSRFWSLKPQAPVRLEIQPLEDDEAVGLHFSPMLHTKPPGRHRDHTVLPETDETGEPL